MALRAPLINNVAEYLNNIAEMIDSINRYDDFLMK